MNYYDICLRAREQDRFSSWCSQERLFRLNYGEVRQNKLSKMSVFSAQHRSLSCVTGLPSHWTHSMPMYVCITCNTIIVFDSGGFEYVLKLFVEEGSDTIYNL